MYITLFAQYDRAIQLSYKLDNDNMTKNVAVDDIMNIWSVVGNGGHQVGLCVGQNP